MNSSGVDYRRLYRLQDKFLFWWVTLDLPFYLTGGTALGRFYLNHRFSEDLDFFVNNDIRYPNYIKLLSKEITSMFETRTGDWILTDQFTRFFITEQKISLKIEVVNDISYYAGKPLISRFGNIDNPLNILSNKLSAIVSRDEPKDIFDILHLARNYSFNWEEVFNHTKQKELINELDVEERLYSFPSDWLKNVNWLKEPINMASFEIRLRQISDDFLIGGDNSLGTDKMPIGMAKILEFPPEGGT